jgi:E3 ubiquitin-protein ligase RAD18
MFPALGHETEAANMKAGRDASYGDVPIGLAKSPREAFESETRKVPMFRVPEEPVLDVESSTTMQ